MFIAALLVVTSVLQQTSVTVSSDSKKGTVVRVTTTDVRDSTRESRLSKRRAIAATPEQLNSAFADAGARSLLARARAAHTGQDSSIRAYEATTLQRLSLGVAFTQFGRERILFRHEVESRVRWTRGVGAQIDVLGRRSAAPMFGRSTEVDIESLMSPVPYYPGRDALWFGLTRASANATDEDIVHPLANSAEAYYTYRTGDSVSFRLPDQTTIRLVELEVRPRRPDWHAVIGSLWFDTSTGQLVRAAYRLSQAVDLLENDSDSDKTSFMARAFLRPSTAAITGVAVEYGLYQGRFWLPRSQVGEGRVQVGFARMPMRIEEKYTYAGVNGTDSLAVVPPRTDTAARPSTAKGRMALDSAQALAREAECASTGSHTEHATRYGGALPVVVHVPCDTALLAHAPGLPKTIYDPAEDKFSDPELDGLLQKAKTMMPVLSFIPQRPRVEWGLNLVRYNRVEGLSSAIDVKQQLASGYALRFSPRIGLADRIPNAELSLTRSTGLGNLAVTGYRRLDAANDWGHPLDFGSGASALLFGRDEGFYYRSTGGELTGDELLGAAWQWRVFHEQESDAIARNNLSLPRAFGSAGFAPQANITAERIRETGGSLRKVSTFGMDPNAFRLASDVRIEGAGGDSNYGRGALDLTVYHALGRLLSRDFTASVTAGAGTSVGDLPVQREWYLGGTNTVRGQAAGAMAGNSFWLTRSEVGYGPPGLRRVAFLDVGWAGDRTSWQSVGRPASGAGIGFSFLDGLIRTDIARGIYPSRNWRSALYLDAKF